MAPSVLSNDFHSLAEAPTKPTIPTYLQIANRKRSERDNVIKEWGDCILGAEKMKKVSTSSLFVNEFPINCGALSAKQLEITETKPSHLLLQLAKGVWSSEDVVRAFIARTIIAQRLTNPLSEVFFARGLERARMLDHHLAVTGKPVGPLHGLPISLKDTFHVRGLPTSLGVIAWTVSIREESDDLVSKLEEAGAVLYCKTNVPQLLMSGECVNYVYGRTSTPSNTLLSAGGSSGGEASLIALGGSPLGIGTDIAGSIRTPANFCGIYGLCPSYGRFPLHSPKFSSSNFVIEGVAGPLARSIDGLEVYSRSILSTRPWEWDSTCCNMPWHEDTYQAALTEKKVSFGFVSNDGVVTPHPPIQRCMKEVKDALVAAGHEVVDLQFFDGSEELWKSALKIFCATGGSEMRQTVRILGEPLIDELLVPTQADTLSVEHYFEAGKKIRLLRQQFLEKWRATASYTSSAQPVDVIILPSGGHVAPPHGTMKYFLYEAISNILDWTCATIPVGVVDLVKDALLPEHSKSFSPLSEEDQQNWATYVPENFENAPVCLQLLGQRHTEERVLAYLRTFENALGRN